MKEPARVKDLSSLVPYVRTRVEAVLAAMKARGFDPVAFEAKRTQERQKWLYGIGRTHLLSRKPVTWTMHSKHLGGKAVDVISKSRGWNWPQFYVALKQEAARVGMHTISAEGCHIQWGE